MRHTRSNCVTASVDQIDFITPVYVGNLVVAKASINYVSKTSMEIGVRVEAECMVTGTRTHVSSAYLTFVALDGNDRPKMVPELILETEEERKRFEAAKERRELRLKNRKKHKHSAKACIVRPMNLR